MKKIFTIVCIAVCMVLLSCVSNYDDSGRFVNLQIENAIQFDNNENYVVGDTIFFELSFSRYLDEDGFPNKLDVFKSSGAVSFLYDFRLNQFSEQANGFRSIDIAEDFIFAEKGTITGFGGVTADLNQEQTVYESRVGIILVETGNFELDFNFFALQSNEYFDDKVQIDIQHRFSGEAPNFEFVVTE